MVNKTGTYKDQYLTGKAGVGFPKSSAGFLGQWIDNQGKGGLYFENPFLEVDLNVIGGFSIEGIFNEKTALGLEIEGKFDHHYVLTTQEKIIDYGGYYKFGKQYVYYGSKNTEDFSYSVLEVSNSKYELINKWRIGYQIPLEEH